jgi:hypothetical protein
MVDPQKHDATNESRVRFTSDCELIEVDEAHTQPSQPGENHRRWMEAKWGKKKPPANGSTEKGA